VPLQGYLLKARYPLVQQMTLALNEWAKARVDLQQRRKLGQEYRKYSPDMALRGGR